MTDDFDQKDWYEVFRAMFKRVTTEEIDTFMKNYCGTKKQIEDVKAAYIKHKGNLNKIMQCVIGFDPENEQELHDIIWHLINKDEVEAYPKFVDEKESTRKKRLEKSKKEAKSAKKIAKDLKRKGQ